MNLSFGNWIRRRRKALDLTQEELARLVGCSPSLIYKIETGERRPSRQVAELLAARLQVPPEEQALFLKVARQSKSDSALDALSPPPAPALAGAAGEPASLNGAPVSAPPSSETPSSQTPSSQTQVPQPQSLDAFPGSVCPEDGERPCDLPVFPTSFIGREFEIGMVVRQLMDPSCRLLTLTGPGGVGKTRLAVEVARQLEAEFPGGVYFLAMAGVAMPGSLVAAIAEGLGVALSGPADPRLQVSRALQGRKVLLVLDNMEHLISGSLVLGEILEQSPGLKLLLTSREQVNLRWEWIFEVQGLPVPGEVSPAVLENNSAVMLFLQRARQASPHFVLTPAEAQAMVQVCRLVDGLPLAIELAASWVRVMSFGEIAAELERGLDLLETTQQDVPLRHRSIRMVFDHSWALLAPQEQSALARLSVFPGAFTRQAAEAVAGASLALLSTLVRKSLLRFDQQAGRYDFHQLVRQMALARLSEDSQAHAQAVEQHGLYYTDWLAEIEPALKSAGQVQASAQIRAETPNWMAAWRWASQRGRLAQLRRMAPCLYWYYEIHGDFVEALSFYQRTIQQLREAGAPQALSAPKSKVIYAFLLNQLGWFQFRNGNTDATMQLFAESLEVGRAFADLADYAGQEAMYHILINWGYLALLHGDIEKAERLTLESLASAQAMASPWHMGIAYTILGVVKHQQGDLEEAFRRLTGSLSMWREVGDPRGLVFCILYLSSAALALGKIDYAEELLNESVAIAAGKMDRWAQASGLDMLGRVSAAREDYAEAARRFSQSMALSREIGDVWAETQTLIRMAEAHAKHGLNEEVKKLFVQAYQNARQAHWPQLVYGVLEAYISADPRVPQSTRLAVARSILNVPAISLEIRTRAERLCSEAAAFLSPSLFEEIVAAAGDKDAETWAEEIFSAAAVTAAPGP